MFFIFVIIAGLLQVTALRGINLLAILVVYAGLRNGPLAGLVAGSGIGLFSEVFSSSPFGLNTALYTIIGAISGAVRSQVYYKGTVFTHFMISFIGLAIFYFLYFILTGSTQPYVFFTVLFSAALSPLVFRMLN